MRILLVFALVTAICRAQHYWIVDRSGAPGTHFTDLPPAVAAASPGDTIRIVSQACPPDRYTAPVITKGLRLLGTRGINLTGPLVIQNVPADEPLVLQDIHLSSGAVLSPGGVPCGVVLQNCGGPIQFENFAMTDGMIGIDTFTI